MKIIAQGCEFKRKGANYNAKARVNVTNCMKHDTIHKYTTKCLESNMHIMIITSTHSITNESKRIKKVEAHDQDITTRGRELMSCNTKTYDVKLPK